MNPFHTPFHTRAHETRLTDAERSRIQVALHDAMSRAPVPSPFFTTTFFFSRALIAAAIIIVVTGGTATYAAEGALPGDVLYPVKVSVNEPLSGAFAFSAEAKANWHADIAETRLAEAEALADKGLLTASTSDELAANFTEHADAVTAIATSSSADDSAAVKALSSRFSAVVAHRGAAILAAGKRSKNAIALRASGDLVVRVASDESESHQEARPAAAARTMMAPALFKAASIESVSVASDATVDADEADTLRSALAEATSTLATEMLSASQSEKLNARVAAIENLIVKGDAELSIGSTTEAAEDFAEAERRIDALSAVVQSDDEIHANTSSGDGNIGTEIHSELNGDASTIPSAIPL